MSSSLKDPKSPDDREIGISNFPPQKENDSRVPLSEQDSNYAFYLEVLKLRRLNTQMHKGFDLLNARKKKVEEQALLFEKKAEEGFRDRIRGERPTRKKRNRRNADEIEKAFQCHVCSKKYGSEGSLKQHQKLKHKGIQESS